MRFSLYGTLRPIAALIGVFGIIGMSLAASLTSAADPLLRPAETNTRAATSVLLGVTRAGEHLVAVGERGIILLSDRQGASWRQVPAPVSVTLTAVSFGSPTQGWAVGHAGVILHSVDGGASWLKQFDGAQAAQIELSTARIAANRSDATDADRRRLRDATRTAAEGTNNPFLAVHFWSASEGIVAGAYGALFATQDGGKTWSSIRSRLDNPKGKHLYGIQDDGRTLYIAGEQGLLFASTDHALSFRPVKTPYGGTFFGVASTPGQGLLAFGLRGNVFRSSDDGRDWEKVDTGLPISVTAAARLPDGSTVLVDESGRVLHDSAQGGPFRAIPVANPFSFTAAAVASDGSLVLAGARGIARIASIKLSDQSRP